MFAISRQLALEVSPYFRLKPQTAEAIPRKIKKAVGAWKKHASALGIARAESEVMRGGFEK